MIDKGVKMKAERDLVRSSKFSGHHRLIISLLALAQFTVILDFMVISPLRDILMKSLEMTPRQFAFSVSSYAFSVADLYSRHAPFFMIVVVSFAVAVLIFLFLEPVDKHLATVDKQNFFHRYTGILANPSYLKRFMLTATVYIGGFLMQPFASAFFINNLKISPVQLPLIFLISGLSSLIVMPVVGKLSDKIDKFKLFAIGS